MEAKTKKKIIISIIIAAIIITTGYFSYQAYKKSQCGQPGQEPC